MKEMTRNASLVATAIFLALGLSGCQSLKLQSISLTGKCTTHFGNPGGGTDCETGATAVFVPEGDGDGGGGMQLLALLTLADEVPDAADFTMDVSGSTVPFPSTGSMNIILTDSSTGIIQGSHVFPWVRTGTVIRLQNADAVNDWVIANAGTTDTIDFKIVPFAANLDPGPQTLAVAAKNEGVTLASFSKTISGGCTSYPSPYQCQMQ